MNFPRSLIYALLAMVIPFVAVAEKHTLTGPQAILFAGLIICSEIAGLRADLERRR